MAKVDLRVFADPNALAREAAQEWLSEMAGAGSMAQARHVALAGGRIARQFLDAAASLAQEQNVSFGAVHFFWSDERCVGPDDPESNFRLAQDAFLGPLNIPAGQIHRIRGEEKPERAAALAAEELRRLIPPGADGQPQLDLVFLGMGEDGHIASLFPGEPGEVMSNPAAFRPATSPKPPPARITMGYPALAAAKQVWVLASGKGKQGALKASLAPDGPTPLARLLRLRTVTRVLTDLAL